MPGLMYRVTPDPRPTPRHLAQVPARERVAEVDPAMAGLVSAFEDALAEARHARAACTELFVPAAELAPALETVRAGVEGGEGREALVAGLAELLARPAGPLAALYVAVAVADAAGDAVEAACPAFGQQVAARAAPIVAWALGELDDGESAVPMVRKRCLRDWSWLGQLADWAAEPRSMHRPGAGAYEVPAEVAYRIAEVEGRLSPGPARAPFERQPRASWRERAGI